MSMSQVEQIDLPTDLIKVMLANKGRYIQQIQKETRTKLSLDKEKEQITATGGIKAIQKVRDAISKLLKECITFPVTKSLCYRLISQNEKENQKNVQVLHNLTDAEVIVDFDTTELKLYGRNLNDKKVKEIVNKWISENKEIEEAIPLEEQRIISYFSINNFEKVNEMRDKSKATYHFSKDSKNPSVTIRGTEDEVAFGKKLLEESLQSYKKCNIVVSTHSAAINVLRNNNGAKLKELEALTKCNVHLEKDTLKVRFSGPTPEVAQAGKKAFDALLADFTLDRIEFDPYLLPLIIGKEGTSIKKIKSESQAFIDIESKAEEASITLSGLTDQVTKAQEMVKDFLQKNYIAKLYVDSAAVAPALIGKEGAIIKKIQESHNVQIDTNSNKKRAQTKRGRKLSNDSEDSSFPTSPKEKKIPENVYYIFNLLA